MPDKIQQTIDFHKHRCPYIIVLIDPADESKDGCLKVAEIQRGPTRRRRPQDCISGTMDGGDFKKIDGDLTFGSALRPHAQAFVTRSTSELSRRRR
jgi:hypothetical protein